MRNLPRGSWDSVCFGFFFKGSSREETEISFDFFKVPEGSDFFSSRALIMVFFTLRKPQTLFLESLEVLRALPEGVVEAFLGEPFETFAASLAKDGGSLEVVR